MKEIIIKLLSKVVKLKKEEIEKLIEIPPSSEMGDYAFPCFALAEKLKKNPNQIALEIEHKIKKTPSEIEEIKVSGAYINFFVNRKKIAENLIKEILKRKNDFGKKKFKLRGMIEFSQANTHKAFHVGHIRGTSIGESLAKIAEFFGEKVIRVNYQGDTGMHVAKWLWCYKKYHSKEKLRKNESWIASIYVDGVKKLAENPKLQKEVDDINRKLGEGKDKKLMNLWKKTRKFSLDSFETIYKELNTKFDKHYFESQFENDGKKISNELVKKKIAKISDGATIVDLEKYGLGIWVLLRKDGSVLYSAKDLALAEKKFRDYDLDSSVYVVGAAQTLHLQQLKKTLEIMNFKKVKNMYFVHFGEVRLPTGKMSSRTGENILYSDFIKEVEKYAEKRIKDRTAKISKRELEMRALKISVAAIKYSMLKQNPNKSILFDLNEALNFEGDTGPYLLYSYARASSILKKVKSEKKHAKKSKIFGATKTESFRDFKISNLSLEETELIKKLSEFPEIVLNAYKNLNPSVIANYSYQLAQIFNEFYHACPVIGSRQETFRLKLVEAFRRVLKNSLNLLGIETIEEM